MKKSLRAPSVRTQIRAAKRESLNDQFLYVLRVLGKALPTPEKEYKFDAVRKWRLDFAFVQQKIGIEMDGGGNGQPIICHQCGAAVRARKADGGLGAVIRLPSPSHYSTAGHARDNEKRNALALQGWAVLSFTSAQLEQTPLEVVQQVQALYNQRCELAAAS